jgi:hypothetical protein
MHEQVASHWCPIQLSLPRIEDSPDTPVPLLTTFLSSVLPRPEHAATMRYAVQLRVLSLREHNGLFGFGDHLERIADVDDVLIVDIGRRNGGFAAWAVWNSQIPGALRDYVPHGEPLGDEDPATGSWRAHVPLPRIAAPILGENARLRLTVASRASL